MKQKSKRDPAKKGICAPSQVLEKNHAKNGAFFDCIGDFWGVEIGKVFFFFFYKQKALNAPLWAVSQNR